MSTLLPFSSMKSCDVKGKHVIVRIDINSPIDRQTKRIVNDNRIAKTAPTIAWLASHGAKIALIAHQGDTDDYQNLIPLDEHAQLLSLYLKQSVRYIDDVCGPAAQQAIRELHEGEVLLLGNLRYLAEEISAFERVVPLEPQQMLSCYLVRSLAPLFDLYINDAFSAAHRKSPSMVAFQKVLPSAAGPLLFDEVEALSRVMHNPNHPCVFVLGGARIGDAFGMIDAVLSNGTADAILTCGITGQVFLMAMGKFLGRKTIAFLESKNLLGYVDQAKLLLSRYASKIEAPIDFAYCDDQGNRKEIGIDDIGDDIGIVDIGMRTIEQYETMLADAKTIFINGPAGIYEQECSALGTQRLWKFISECNAYTVIGGGDSVAAAKKFTRMEDWSYVCTAGGAMVQFLSSRKLPLLQAMEEGYSL